MDNWIQVEIYTSTRGLEPVGAALMEIGLGAFSIRDAADFESFLEGKSGHWDYIDEELMKLRDAETTITLYLPDSPEGNENLAMVRDTLERLRGLDAQGEWGRLAYALSGVREEDWANAWKQYYKPVPIGDRLIICPSWEDYAVKGKEVVLQMDPGMAFGSGTHETTRLCLEILEKRIAGGETVLDIGCGSGILSVAALLLGADHAAGIDIDPVAVRVACENAARNGVADRAVYRQGSLAGDVTGTFDVICANIVADVIMEFAPIVPKYLKPAGCFLVSGIIDTREDEVRQSIGRCGMKQVERIAEGGWVAMLFVPEE